MQNINWDKVLRNQSGALIGVAFRYLGERKTAEDLVQDALIIAIQKAETFSGKGVFEAWLRKIVVNECLMHLRKKKQDMISLDESLHAMADEEAEHAEDADFEDDKDMRKVIKRCDFSKEDLLEIAAKLPEQHRLTFNLYVMDGFSHKEIANELKISEGTSKSNLNRARKKMQDLLYEKALDMQKTKKKRWLVAVWFSALFGKTNIVDAAYNKAFANFTLPVPPPSAGLAQAMAQTTATATVGGLSATATAIIAGSIAVGGIGATVGIVEYQNHRRAEEQSQEVEYQSVTEEEGFFENADYPVDADLLSAPADDLGHHPPTSENNRNILKDSTKISPTEEKLPPVIINHTTIIEEEDTTDYED